METFAARLASFDVAYPGLKRRASNAKSSKAITWPHSSPSPSELALAGFYYKPTPEGPDNACCFLCERNLDGWEEDDDAAVEHLRYSADCGWAITINAGQNGLDPADLEDPTGERMTQARKATFSIGWPPDSKRGWTCRTQKMVDAGWYYCPTPECEETVTCTYCKLSLDGWEPKDNPYDEHYKRSPDCPFFAIKARASQKAPRVKKSRQSKTQRLSTLSSNLLDTDTSNIPDLNDSIDISLISQDTVISTASKMSTKGKKGAKGRGKNTRAKKTDPVVIDGGDMELDVTPQPPPKSTRGKKRTSDEISQDDYDRGARESTVKPEPPPKRRATRSRDSSAQQVSYPSLAESTAEPMEVEEVPMAKPVRGGRKRASSRTRKASTTSIASKASLRSAVPDAAEIEAALEADLDRPLSDEEDIREKEHISTDDQALKPQPKKGKGKGTTKGAASTTATRRTRKAHAEDESQVEIRDQEPSIAPESVDVPMSGIEADAEHPKKTRTTKSKKATTGSKRARKEGVQTDDPKPTDSSIITADTEASIMTAPIIEDDSGHETDASTVSRPKRQNDSKKKGVKGKGKKGGVMNKNIEDIVHPSQSMDLDLEKEKDSQIASQAPNVSEQDAADEQPVVDEPPKKITRGKGTKAKGSKAKKLTKAPHLSMPGAFSPPPIEATPDPEQNNETRDSVTEMLKAIEVPHNLRGVGADLQIPLSLAQRLSMQSGTSTEQAPLPEDQDKKDVGNDTIEKSEPIQSPQSQNEVSQMNKTSSPKASTPLPSPQSSDAENHPPSARPESKRPPPPSPAQIATTTTTKVPLAASVTTSNKMLSPSKQQANDKTDGLVTSYPWDPVDIEMAFVQSATLGNENLPPMFSKDLLMGDAGALSSPQKKMTVEQWVRHLAAKSEEELKSEGERVVGCFEREGGRAMRCLEGIDCID